MVRKGWVRGGVARTGAAHLVLPRIFPRHHADIGQSRGLPGEKGSLSISHQNRRFGGRDRRDGAGSMGAGWGWCAQEPHTSLCPGLFRAITPIPASPGVFLVRKAHWALNLTVPVSRLRAVASSGGDVDGEGSTEGVGDARKHNASGSLGTVLGGGDDRLARPRAPG